MNTPFLADGAIDVDGIRRSVDAVVDAGVAGTVREIDQRRLAFATEQFRAAGLSIEEADAVAGKARARARLVATGVGFTA